MANETRLLWVDLETTGLDPDRDLPLAVGFRLTDSNLDTIAAGEWIVGHSYILLPPMSEHVHEMHTDNGLLARIGLLSSPCWHNTACELMTWLEEYCPSGCPVEERPLVAGSSILFDRSFLRRWLPRHVDHVHYRILDVSSTREMVRMRRPDLLEGAPEPAAKHMPLSDIDDSMRLHRFLEGRLELLADESRAVMGRCGT